MIEITNIEIDTNTKTLYVDCTRVDSEPATVTVRLYNEYPDKDKEVEPIVISRTLIFKGASTLKTSFDISEAEESLVYFVEADVSITKPFEFTTVSFIINFIPIYRESLKYIKEMNNNCSIPKGFIDYILRVKALDAISKTEDAQEVGKCWNKLFYERKLSNIKIPDSICYGHNN